jgi:hypothetical protein
MSRSVRNASWVTASLKRSPRRQPTPCRSAMSGTGHVPHGLKRRACSGLSPWRIYWMSSTSMPSVLIEPHPPGAGRSCPVKSAATKLVDSPSLADRCSPNVYVVVSGDGDVTGASFSARRTRSSVDGPRMLGSRHTHAQHKPLVGGNRIPVNEKSAAHRTARRLVRGTSLPGRASRTLAQTCNRLTKGSATEVGVDVTWKVWNDRPRVWHMVAPIPPDGHQAIERIGEFMRAHTG